MSTGRGGRYSARPGHSVFWSAAIRAELASDLKAKLMPPLARCRRLSYSGGAPDRLGLASGG